MQIKKILAGPGTGKTHRMLDYFEQELKTVKPNRIAFLTFTRTAKAEALGRTRYTQDDLPFLRTIHSICYRQMGISREQMIRPMDLKAFGMKIGKKISGKLTILGGDDGIVGGGSPATPEDILLQLNHLGRHMRIGLKAVLRRDPNADIELGYATWFTQQYRAWREAESLLDYTDILTTYLEHGRPLPIDILLIDESQDLSELQWDVIHKLGANAQRWYMVGDENQAIFEWAGASVRRFLAEPCSEQEFLEQSYRLPRKVLDYSQRILDQISQRVPRPLKPRDAEGQVRVTGDIDAKLFDIETLFLVRNHFRGLAIANDIIDLNVPFSGPYSPLSQAGATLILSALSKAEKKEILTTPEVRGLLEHTAASWILPGAREFKSKPAFFHQILKKVPRAKEWPEAFKKLNEPEYIATILEKYGLPTAINPKAKLTTIHQAKGKQAERVILDNVISQKTLYSSERNPEEEHRVWYVGVTRARSELVSFITPSDMTTYRLPTL